jgi:hypothetical protein
MAVHVSVPLSCDLRRPPGGERPTEPAAWGRYRAPAPPRSGATGERGSEGAHPFAAGRLDGVRRRRREVAADGRTRLPAEDRPTGAPVGPCPVCTAARLVGHDLTPPASTPPSGLPRTIGEAADA